MLLPSNLFTIFAINSTVVCLCVLIHYEVLSFMSRALVRQGFRRRFLVVIGVFGALVAHTVEVWLFAAGYYFMHHAEGWGELTGNVVGSYLDCIYFSFSTYSTLGYGDIAPVGNIRYLTSIESLTGLVLITWSASFLFLEMQSYWSERRLDSSSDADNL